MQIGVLSVHQRDSLSGLFRHLDCFKHAVLNRQSMIMKVFSTCFHVYSLKCVLLVTDILFMQFLFGILLLLYVPTLDPFPGYTPLRAEALVDNTDYELLPGGEQICPERHANVFSSKHIELNILQLVAGNVWN